MPDESSQKPVRVIETNENSKIKNFFSDFKNWVEKQDWVDIGITISIFLILVSIGMIARLLLAFYFRKYYYYDYDPVIWNRIIDLTPSNIPLYGFTDFPHYYLEWARAWFEENWRPYTIWSETEPWNILNFYSYPPLFLYTIMMFWRPSMLYLWAALPIIFTDAACAGIVYLILKEIVKGKHTQTVAIIGGILMALSPINLIYEGVYWFNLQPVTFFTLVSFYFVTKRKWWQAFFWLALASMSKQNALFFVYPLFMFMIAEKIRNKGVKKGTLESLTNVGIYLITCVFASIPWIFISPEYLPRLFSLGGGIELTTTIIEPALTQTIKFSWSIYVIGIKGWFAKIIAFGINSMLLMVVSATVIAELFLWRSYKNKLDYIEFFEFITLYAILIHIFMPRGVYKFYSAYYFPMIIIALLGSLSYYIKNRKTALIFLILGVIIFIAFSITHIWIPRNGTPLLLLLISFIIITMVSIRIRFRSKSDRSFYYEKELGSM